MSELPKLGVWAAICPSCGAKPSQPCYGNGDMPKSLTHSARIARVDEEAHLAHDALLRTEILTEVRKALAESPAVTVAGRGGALEIIDGLIAASKA